MNFQILKTLTTKHLYAQGTYSVMFGSPNLKAFDAKQRMCKLIGVYLKKDPLTDLKGTIGRDVYSSLLLCGGGEVFGPGKNIGVF